MNPIEILNRGEGSVIYVDEQIKVIEWYIKQRKSVDVQIRIPLPTHYVGNIFGKIEAIQELQAINHAFSVVCEWYAINKNKIK